MAYDGDDVTEILDVLGMTIAVKDLATLVKVTEELHGRDDVVRIKDRYKETKDGYRDVLANVQLSDGMIAEVQVNVEQMLAAKQGPVGHKLYEITRGLEKEVKAGRLTEEQYNADMDFLNEMSQAVYGEAYQAVLEESSFNAYSRDIDWASSKARARVNRDLVSVLSSFTLNKLTEFGLSTNNSELNTSPSMSKNLNLGSSKDGISAAGLDEATLSTGAAEAEPTESSFISVPSTTNISHGGENVNGIQEKNSPENEQRIAKARAKWEAAERTVGAEDQITLQTGAEITGHYELGEAGISTPSVDPDADFTQSEGFPVNENGTSMNVGRDYTGGFSREAAIRMAAQFDQRGMGIVVDSNGVTGSGNNRDISRRIAARNGTDGKYVAYLKSRPERWGFTQEDVAKYRHPTLYFVAEAPAAYTPLYFDQFNRSGKKSVSPLETAIKMSYLVDRDMVNEFSAAMGNYDSVSELYEDTQAATEIFKSLMKKGIVTENSYPDYVEAMTVRGKQQERVTEGGKAFLESVMLGAVLNEDSIRSLALVPEIRKRVVKGQAALVDNAALGEYGVIAEINQAVAIAVEVQTNKKKYKGIEDYAGQSELELGQRVSTDIEVELAGRLLEKTEYGFADMMGGLNAVLREEAGGQSDIFGGTSKDDILRRYLGVKAKVDGVRAANTKIIESDTASMAEKVEAALDNAGLAKGEADGTLFQAAYHGSPYRFERFDSSHMGTGEGAHTYGWGHYFAGKKEVAEYYRETISRRTEQFTEMDDKEFSGRTMAGWYKHWEKEVVQKSPGETRPLFDRMAMIEDLLINYDYKNTLNNAIENEYATEAIEWFEKTFEEFQTPGQLYEVDIPGDEEMLDWDKPLDEQPENIRVAMEKIFEKGHIDRLSDYDKGEDIYRRLADKKFNGQHPLTDMEGYDESQKAASMLLSTYGIKGIRYLDQLSRNAVDGTYNYVIFDDSDIEITQTFFQLEGELVEDAAQYDTWRDFRDAYEGHSRSILEGKPVASVSSKDIPIINEEPITTALEWINRNPIGNVETVIGDVEVTPSGIDNSFGHTKYKNKVFVLPAVKAILQEGAFLSELDDFNPENNIRNYYFAAPVALDEERKIVFIRVRQVEEGSKKFHVHEVFTEDEIRAAAPLQEEIDKRKPGNGPNAASFPGIRAGNQSDLYRSIINNVLTVNPNARATDAWYRSLWNDAQKIRGDTLFQHGEEKGGRAEELDKRWAGEADKKYLGEALRELHRVHNDQALEPAEDESDAAHEEYRRVKRLQHRIRTELPNAGSIVGMAAQVNSGTGLSSRQYDRLKGWIRKNTRDYRAVFADIMGQEEYLEDLADTKDGEPAGRLADPRPDKQDIKARLKEIAGIVRESDPALAGEIEDGTVRYDDPRIAAFEAGVDAEYGKAKAALDTLEQETAQDFARLANDAQRRIVAAYERVLETRGQMDGTNEKLRRMMDEEGKIAEPYQRRQRLEKASYDTVYQENWSVCNGIRNENIVYQENESICNMLYWS